MTLGCFCSCVLKKVGCCSLGVWGILLDYAGSRFRFRVLSLLVGSVLFRSDPLCLLLLPVLAGRHSCWFRLVSFGSVLAAAGLPGRVLLSKASKNAGIVARSWLSLPVLPAIRETHQKRRESWRPLLRSFGPCQGFPVLSAGLVMACRSRCFLLPCWSCLAC